MGTARILATGLLLALWAPAVLRAADKEKEEEPVPATEHELLSAGVDLYTNRSYGKALVYFDRLLERNPGHAVARYYRALVHIHRVDYEKALADLDVTAKARPGSFRVRVQRGRALLALGRYEEALADLRQARAAAPEGKPVPGLDGDIRQAEALLEASRTVGPGAEAPSFRLMGASGRAFDLSSLKGRNYVVLVFYSTWASALCRDQLSQYNEFQKELGRRQAVAVAVSTDDLKHSIELREKKGLTLRILSDPEAEATRAYGLVSLRHGGPPRALPAVIVVDREGKVAHRKVSYDPRDRATPEKILQVLDALIRKGQPGKEGEDKGEPGKEK